MRRVRRAGQINLTGWRCGRCTHVWLPRPTTETPAVCPKCKSPYWNRPRASEAKGAR